MADAVMKALDMCGLHLPTMSEKFTLVYLIVQVDSCSVNALFCDWLQMVTAPNVIVVRD